MEPVHASAAFVAARLTAPQAHKAVPLLERVRALLAAGDLAGAIGTVELVVEGPSEEGLGVGLLLEVGGDELLGKG